MSSLARVLADWGWRLSGSDAGAVPGWMARAGVWVSRGHAAENLPAAAELLVHSDAVAADNPERREAAGRGLPVLSYFEVLGRLTACRQTLAVAGTHGKSTTVAMLGTVLSEAGLDPTVIGGGVPMGEESGGRAGRGRLMVVEACEYRANFLKLHPHAAAILNVEADHFDYYRSPAELDAAFADFAGRVPTDGLMVVRSDCARARRAATVAQCRVETFGLVEEADWSPRHTTADGGYYRFEIWHAGQPLGDVRLRVPGEHNVLNALAAAALAAGAGAWGEAILAGLNGFRGIRRRLESRGAWRGVVLVDDYAHHPTEVRAALRTIRQMYPGARLWCVFQPHQASRTAALLDELAASLENTETVLVAEVFRAREPAVNAGVTAADLAARARSRGVCVPPVHSAAEIVRHLRTALRPGDVLLTLGAGDIGNLHETFTETQ